MSVLIKGMEMPKGCSFCKMKEQDRHGQCSITGTEWENDTKILLNFDSDKERLSDCPLVELPEKHGRLVDVDELSKKMYHDAFESDTDLQKWDSGCWIRYKMFENNRDNAPTIIEAEEGD